MKNTIKRVFILLPRPRRTIAGGYQVVYQYANMLCQNGYIVSIGYDCMEIGNKYRIHNKYIKKILGKYLLNKSKWFNLVNVNQYLIGSINDIQKIDSDLYIATAVNTIDHLIEGVSNSAKIAYFIQGLETWLKEYDPYQTYSYPVRKITVSKWLSKVVSKYTNKDKIYLCPNGINQEIFNISKPIEFRENKSISFLYHKDFTKGPDVLEETIREIKRRYKDIKLYSFGVFEKPDFLEENDIYIQNATPNQVAELYNSSSIFLSTSREEGFGLTGLEAMSCGCALVTTRTNGALEYADCSNSMLCQVENSDELISAITDLIEDNELRISKAKTGYESATYFTLEKSNFRFLNIIDSILEDN